MKKFIIFILLIISVNIQSQVRLNYTLSSIQKEFKQYPQKIEDNILKIYDNDVIIYYYFENKLCNKVIISTKSLFVANYIINDYNKNYERIGDTEWTMNSNEYGYAKIYFEFTKNYYNFIWK